MSDIKVSVIMPVYNAEKYLNMAMDSLLCQTLTDIEIICVDDGSTDNSLNILEEYASKDNRITILKQQNQYAGVARNNGMKIAKGKYLSFLDADDYFKSDMLKKAYECAEKEQAEVVVFGGEYFVGELENAYHQPVLLNEDLVPEGDSFEQNENLFTFTIGAPWNKLFLHSFVMERELKYHPCKRSNDIYFVYIAMACASRIALVREDLLSYRTGNSASLQGSNSDTPMQFIYEMLDIQEQLVQLGSYEKYKKNFRELCLRNSIYNLGSQKDIGAFVKLYEELKNNAFEKFGLLESNIDDYHYKPAYRQYEKIMNTNFADLIKTQEKDYLFPFALVDKNADIILYAAGKVGRQFYEQIKQSGYCNLIAWVDKNAADMNDKSKSNVSDSITIKSPKEIDMNNCDCIVIAIEHENMANRVMAEIAEKYNVPEEKMVWKKPNV